MALVNTLKGFTKVLLAVWLNLGAMQVWGGGTADDTPVPVDFFFEAGCESCATIRRDVLPELELRYAGYYVLREWEIGEKTNYLRLVAYQDRLKAHDNEPVSMVVDEREFLAGLTRIRKDLFAAVEAGVARRATASQGVIPNGVTPAPDTGELLKRRVGGFTLVGVIGAALVDSINPCAISTLVFFMSLLSVARIGVRRMIVAGLAFLAACFVTYVAIGFGLLRVVQFLNAWQGVRQVLDWMLIAMMLGFAFLSFRDALRYHRSGQAGDVSLKLPASIQDRIHRVMKSGLRRRSLILGGFGAGVAVTVLESVCTGQVYVPALVMMLKNGESLWRCTLYLLLYNLIFVMPLAIVLGLTCGGMSIPTLMDWSRRNVAVSKILLGVFFVAMTVLMVALR